MELNAHLSFSGDCEAAFKFYEKNLGAKITFLMPYEGSPAANDVPVEWRGKVLHATLKIGDEVLTGCDVPGNQYKKPQGISIIVSGKDSEEAERVFQALSENGIVQTPLQETFWAIRFGMVTDRFGIPWMINCEKPHEVT
jgi:PhnB protein